MAVKISEFEAKTWRTVCGGKNFIFRKKAADENF